MLRAPAPRRQRRRGAVLLRTVLLLTSPMAWLYWKDYLGLDPEAAAATAGWAIKTLTSAR